ncbi:MAG TPA: hypothetical protein VIJ12_05005 [Candidatus Baltobacteraceae bacterium]
MIEDVNPAIDVNDLMAKVNEQIEGRYAASLIQGSPAGGLSADVTTMVAGIEQALHAAEAASHVRTSIGRSSRLLGGSTALQGFVLRVLAFILRDQRNVNAAVVEALRKSLQLNIRLSEEVDRLKSRLPQPPA